MIWRIKELASRFLNKKSLADNKKNPGYFEQARSWADDHYLAIVLSRKRYQAAFFAISGLCGITVLGLLLVTLKQTTELVVVHEGVGFHYVTLEKPNTKVDSTWAQTQADIAHYVVARESYDPILYRYQGKEVALLSQPSVNAAYEELQSSKNEPMHLLGSAGYRTVEVNSVLRIDDDSPNKNTKLAKVDFTVTDHWFNESLPKMAAYTALVSWRYNGIPSDPTMLLQNWSGFQVLRYVRQTVSPSTSESL